MNDYAALVEENAVLRRAMEPFARIWRINEQLEPDQSRPVRDFIAGAWPTMADCKNADQALASTPRTGAVMEALQKAEAQFRWYADEHTKAGKHDKAKTNYGMAYMCRDALARLGEG